MKNSYDKIEELFSDIEKDIEDTLMDEVLEEVKEIEMEHIEDDVFLSYSPKIYERRGVNGIGDPDNIIGTVHNMELDVENVTQFAEGYGTYNHGIGLTELINDGGQMGGYFYDYDGEFTKPRPFIDNTANEIENTDKVENALERGLKNRGYDVK